MYPFEGPPEEEFQREILSWNDIDKLIDHLIPQFRGEFDGLLMITKGGLVPGGLLSEALGIKDVLTASVYFPDEVDKKLAWPTFMQFPPDTLLTDRRILIVDDIWANGRAIMMVRGRLAAAARPPCCIIGFAPTYFPIPAQITMGPLPIATLSIPGKCRCCRAARLN